MNPLLFLSGDRTSHRNTPGPEGVYRGSAAAPHIAGVGTKPEVPGPCLHDCQPVHGCRSWDHHLLPGSRYAPRIHATTLQRILEHHTTVLQHRYIRYGSHRSGKYKEVSDSVSQQLPISISIQLVHNVFTYTLVYCLFYLKYTRVN